MSCKKSSGVFGFGPHQMTGAWVGFVTDDASGETGVAAADVIAGDEPEEEGTGATDLHDSDRLNERKTSVIQDKLIPFFISTFLSRTLDSFPVFELQKP
jgi:hypothetical protein